MDKLNFMFDDYEPHLKAGFDNIEICLYTNSYEDGRTEFKMHVTCWEEFWSIPYQFSSIYDMLDGANKWYQSYKKDVNFLKMEQITVLRG